MSVTFLRKGFSKEQLNCLVTFSITKIFSTAINTCNGFLWFPSRGRHSCRIGSWFFLKGLPCTQWCRSHLDRHLCIAHTTGPATARSPSCLCRPYSPDSGGFEKRPKYHMRSLLLSYIWVLLFVLTNWRRQIFFNDNDSDDTIIRNAMLKKSISLVILIAGVIMIHYYVGGYFYQFTRDLPGECTCFISL